MIVVIANLPEDMIYNLLSKLDPEKDIIVLDTNPRNRMIECRENTKSIAERLGFKIQASDNPDSICDIRVTVPC